MSDEESTRKIRVRLLKDIIVNSKPGKIGEEHDVPLPDARYLVNIGSAEKVETDS